MNELIARNRVGFARDVIRVDPKVGITGRIVNNYRQPLDILNDDVQQTATVANRVYSAIPRDAMGNVASLTDVNELVRKIANVPTVFRGEGPMDPHEMNYLQKRNGLLPLSQRVWWKQSKRYPLDIVDQALQQRHHHGKRVTQKDMLVHHAYVGNALSKRKAEAAYVSATNKDLLSRSVRYKNE